jgi:hypothetical protein
MTISDLLRIFNQYPLHTVIKIEDQRNCLIALDVAKITSKKTILAKPDDNDVHSVLILGSSK